jgi:hypothetical protein
MSMASFQTSVGLLGMSRGERQSWAPNVRAVEPTGSDRRGQRKGHLYVLAELIGVHPSPQVLYRQIVNVIQRVYYESASSVGAALQSAIMEAHLLMQEAGATGGVSCIVLRDDDLHIAQVIPALVIVANPSIVQLFPISPRASQHPLGGDARPDIGVFHAPVETPTAILLAESGWLTRAEDRMLAGAVTAPSVAGILNIMEELAGRSTLSAMVVGVGLPTELPEDLAHRESAGWLEEVPEGEAEDIYWAERDVRKPARDREEAARVIGELARGAGKGLATATVRIAESAKTLGERMLPEAEPEEGELEPAVVDEPVATPTERRPPRWPVIVAIVIPLLAIAAAAVLWWQRDYQRSQEFASLMEGARAALDSAAGIEDEALVRGQLVDAEERITQALALKPGDPDGENLEREIRRALDHVNRVVGLPMLMPLAEVSGTGRDLGRVVLNGRDIYILDRGADEVLWYRMDAELPDVAQPVGDGPVIRKGQQVGQLVVSELGDIAWLTAAGYQERSGLLVLDQSGGLFLNDASGMWEPINLPLHLPGEWRYPQSAATYQGNFYVLEPSLNQVFRYLPSGAGYAEAPSEYFEETTVVNLGGAVDMAINSEACGGHIYLLYRNGILTKYTRGVPEPFEVVIPDQRLQDTPAFFVGPEKCHLYVADAGNGRLVELDASGTFLFQYRLAEGEALHSARSLFVDEAVDAFYILTEDTLYRTPIPR